MSKSNEIRIIELFTRDFKRIQIAEMQPKEFGLTLIDGNNAQGKTSALDAIAWALGGDSFKPMEPNRVGGKNADIEITLSGGWKVKRSGKNGTLSVTGPDGKAGQTALNELIGKFSISLPKFFDLKDSDRLAAIAQAFGLKEELDAAAGKVTVAYNERTGCNTIAKRSQAALGTLNYNEDIEEPGPIDEAINALEKARQENDDFKQVVNRIRDLDEHIKDRNERISEMQKKIESLKAEVEAFTEERSELEDTVEGRAPIDLAPLQEKIARHSEASAAWEGNKKYMMLHEQASKDAEAAELAEAKVQEARKEYNDILSKIDVPGLTVEDGELRINGIPWTGLSSMQQYQIAIAVGAQAKPSCRFVLVDRLETFDPQQRQELATWAAEKGVQIIGTVVGKHDDATFTMTDGVLEPKS